MPPLSGHRPTWAEIDLENLAFNFSSVKKFVGPGVEIMSVVKADAYGHGSVECSKRLEAEGTDWFAVAIPEEGVELRRGGITKPILCLGCFWPGQEEIILRHAITPVIIRLDQAQLLNNAAEKMGTVVPIHVKIDTGMGRVGVRFDQLDTFSSDLLPFKNLNLEGLMTHFAVADKLEENEFTNEQISRFHNAVEIFHQRGFRPKYVDMANSPGAVAHPHSRSNLVRLGGVLYGLGGDVLPQEIELPELMPVMSLHSQISMIKRVPAGESIGYGRTFSTERDSMIATVPIGYHDGLNRSLSNKGKMIVNGHFAPIVGRISMDWTTLDVTDAGDVKVGDQVTIIGSQGTLCIKAEDVALAEGTISYETTCSIDKRVPRVFVS